MTFPLTEKIEVNGSARHPIYEELVQAPNEQGVAGDITWNFEKFLLDSSGKVVARFSPRTEPDDPALVAAVQALL